VAAGYFDRRRFEIERGYGKQYALGLKHWHTNAPVGGQQLQCFKMSQNVSKCLKGGQQLLLEV
jgi:hypothetical protein